MGACKQEDEKGDEKEDEKGDEKGDKKGDEKGDEKGDKDGERKDRAPNPFRKTATEPMIYWKPVRAYP